jgi:threonine dehydrogenase-like Zn-dependent dehydrogenase
VCADVSDARLELAAKLGASQVINVHKKEVRG